VVLLHGFPEFWYAWRHQLPALADAGYRVVAPDLPGYNTSDKPPRVRDYRPRLLIQKVADLIMALGADSATVAGHDWGGGLAWLLAVHHPERVQRLVVGAFTAQDIDRYVAAAAQPGALRAAINYYRAAVRPTPGPGQGLRRVDVPTLVIWGDQDRYLGRELAEPDPAWVPEVRVERIPRPATGSRPTPPNGSTTSWWTSSSPSAG
jgi:pimeloyl-ACP methyl ester carboxylesterase